MLTTLRCSSPRQGRLADLRLTAAEKQKKPSNISQYFITSSLMPSTLLYDHLESSVEKEEVEGSHKLEVLKKSVGICPCMP